MNFKKTYPQNLYKIEVCDRKQIKDFVEKHHYSKSINGLKITICFKVLQNDELVGAVIFGELSTTAWKKYSDNEKDIVELRRLVLLDHCVFNSESWVISKCLKWIKKNTKYKMVISYADPHYGHEGIIYKASNFKYLGKTNSDILYKHPESGKLYHSRALRTKYKGKLKPFAEALQKLKQQNKLEQIKVEGKHIYIYTLSKTLEK